MKKKLAILMIFIFSILTYGFEFENLNIKNESSFILTKEKELPLWSFANKAALYRNEESRFYNILSISQNLKSEKVIGDYKLTLDSYLNDSTNNAKFSEGYINLNYMIFNMKLGKFTAVKGEKNELSSGSILLSENAPALNRIKLGFKDYEKIPFTKERLFVKGSISHVWLGEDRDVKNAYLHEKDMYLKLKINSKASCYAGLNHEAVWGGDGKPSSFSDFWRVFQGDGGDGDADWSDQKNLLGDHKGIYNAGLEYKTVKADMTLYYQHFFEDRSGMKYKNIQDGLFGISIERKEKKFLRSLTFEFFDSRSQSGTSPHDNGGGKDYYYENSIYSSDWISDGLVMGTPFARIENGEFIHTRIKAFHLGIAGRYRDYDYKVLASRTENYGTYDDLGNELFKEGLKEWYFFFEINRKNLFSIDGSYFNLKLGYDTGELYEDRFAVAPGIGINRKF